MPREVPSPGTILVTISRGRILSHGDLYAQHLATLDRDLGKALEQAARSSAPVEAVVFHSGRQQVYHADDKLIPFEATPHFRRWVPLSGPEHLVLARPGQKPRVVRVTPKDFWYDTEPAPISYWEQSVDLVEVATFAEAVDAIGTLAGAAYVGGAPDAAEELGIEGVGLRIVAGDGDGLGLGRGLLEVAKGATGSKSKVVCDALILDPESRSDTYPYIRVDENENVSTEHEATVSKIGEEQLFYLMSRGLSEAEASAMIVNGFVEPITKELPLEYAVELNRLIELQMEGSVG